MQEQHDVLVHLMQLTRERDMWILVILVLLCGCDRPRGNVIQVSSITMEKSTELN